VRLAWRCHDGQAAESSATRLAAMKQRVDGGGVNLAR